MKYVIVRFRNFVSSAQFPKMLVNNCPFMLLKSAEKQRPHLHRRRSKKSRNWLHYVCMCVCVCIYIYIFIYTVCPRRNVPDFGRVFLMLKYTDITQNTYVQS